MLHHHRRGGGQLGELKRATQAAVEQSFNRITIDGDTSTNDTVIVMSNGASGMPLIKSKALLHRDLPGALRHVMVELAKMIVRDGERVTKFVEIRVQGRANLSRTPRQSPRPWPNPRS